MLVEDNEDDVFLMQRALGAAQVVNPVVVVRDGEEAIRYLSGESPYQDRAIHPLPVVVFLDLKLPFQSGHEVLAWIRAQRALESLVVVVLTSSDEPYDLRRAYSVGANSYLMKPMSAAQLSSLAQAFNWSWLRYRESEEVIAAKK
ncbi:MAG: hypothetical protein RIQ93_813 [Verrucomicrobiota bacterium]